MAVTKFTLTEENYKLALEMRDEIDNTITINLRQLKRVHELATILTGKYTTAGCSSCNRKAIQNIKAYIYQYEEEYGRE